MTRHCGRSRHRGRHQVGAPTLPLASFEIAFEIEAFRKHCLLHGLDDIGLTMQHADTIKSFEQQYYAAMPWLK